MGNTRVFKDVLDFTCSEYSATKDGDILFVCDYASELTISSTAERLKIRGGSHNYSLTSIDHSRECTTNVTLPLVDMSVLAVKAGRTVTTGATVVPMPYEILTASKTNTITLSHTPISGTLKIYKALSNDNPRDLGAEQEAGTPGTTENEYSISGTTVTLNATTAPEGTKFFAKYDYTSGAAARNLKITADDFPSYVRLTFKGLEKDDISGNYVPVTVEIYKAQVQTDFELIMSAGSASNIQFNCDCYTVLDSANDKTFYSVTELIDEIAS